MSFETQDSLDRLVTLLRDGRTYYRHAVVHTDEPEVSRAFGLAAEARDGLIVDLREAGLIEAGADLGELSSAHGYEALRRQFDPRHPESHADALVEREEATLRLVESVFRAHPAIVVRGMMKKHYMLLQQAAAIIRRLSIRQHAA